jgi:hypothetical protein
MVSLATRHFWNRNDYQSKFGRNEQKIIHFEQPLSIEAS